MAAQEEGVVGVWIEVPRSRHRVSVALANEGARCRWAHVPYGQGFVGQFEVL